MGDIGHGRRVFLVLHESLECFSVCHNVIKPCQSLDTEGGRLRHCGFEAIGGITIRGGSHRRDRYAGWIYDPREKRHSSPLILSPSLLAPLWWVVWRRKVWGSALPPLGIVTGRTHPRVHFVVALAFDLDSGCDKCLWGIFMSRSSSG